MRQEKEIKTTNMKKEVKISLSHVENPKESSKQPLELIREFSEVTGIKVHIPDTPRYPNVCGSKWQGGVAGDSLSKQVEPGLWT